MLKEKFYHPKFIENPIIAKEYFGDYEKDCIKLEISGEEYRICEEYSFNRWSNTKKGDYGKGIANTKNDPYKVDRVGLLGEMAIGKIFDLPVDLTYRVGGDECDFILAKRTKSNSKCRIKKHDEGIVVCENDCGKKMSVSNDVYIFSYLASESVEYKKAKIVIVGFCKKEFVLSCKIKDGLGGVCKNYTVPYYKTKSVIGLRDLHFKYKKNEKLFEKTF